LFPNFCPSVFNKSEHEMAFLRDVAKLSSSKWKLLLTLGIKYLSAVSAKRKSAP